MGRRNRRIVFGLSQRKEKKMNSFTKIALVAGIAAFAFRTQLEHALGIGTSTPTGEGDPGIGPGAPAPGAAAAPAGNPNPATPYTDAAGTKARILAAAQSDAAFIAGNGRMSVYQWDYYYKLVRGLDAPADIGFSDNAALVSIDEYWQAATSHGLSGVSRRPGRRAAAAWEM
jgi:hypothetical protein